MQSILNGFFRYRARTKGQFMNEFENSRKYPQPSSIIFTCIDSRIVASRITQASPGDIFMSRNPGSLLPNYSILDPKIPRTEEAALELACVHNKIDTVVMAGHSDCKAANLVYDNRYNLKSFNPAAESSVLKKWLMINSTNTIQKYLELEKDFKKPVTINVYKDRNFQAFIDPDNEFDYNDKFSQLNTLMQLENLKSFSFIQPMLANKKLQAYAMWLDIYSGNVYVFNYDEARFVRLDDESFIKLNKSIDKQHHASCC